MYICVRILYSMTGVLEEKARRREREIRKWRKKQIWRKLLIIWFPNFNLSIKIISGNFVFSAVLFVLVSILISIFVKPISSFSSAKTSYFLKPAESFLMLYSLLSIQICYSQSLLSQNGSIRCTLSFISSPGLHFGGTRARFRSAALISGESYFHYYFIVIRAIEESLSSFRYIYFLKESWLLERV